MSDPNRTLLKIEQRTTNYRSGILSQRETEALTLSAQGKDYTQIAKLLSVTGNTARMHIKNACRKLNAKNKTHATALAISMGLIASVHPRMQVDDDG